MGIKVSSEGPIPARIMIVGEAPSIDDEVKGRPFVGMSGKELDKMLHEAGISRSECFVTYVSKERPPKNDINLFIAKSKKEVTENPGKYFPLYDKMVCPPILEGFKLLRQEVKLVKPNIIVACGNVPMWALTREWGITKWRGSMLETDFGFNAPYFENDITFEKPIKVIPVYHPSAILRQWSWRSIAVQDLRRAAKFRDGSSYPTPDWNFITRPNLAQVLSILNNLLVRLTEGERIRISFDIETGSSHIVCAGIAWTLTDALCIPFKSRKNPTGYWSLEEEAQIIWLLYKLLTHKNVEVIGQNIIYDSQYTWRYWHFVPRVFMDTMIAQHSAFSDLPKALAFICSMYCDYYKFWKEDK